MTTGGRSVAVLRSGPGRESACLPRRLQTVAVLRPRSATYLRVRGLPASLSCSVFAAHARTNSRTRPLLLLREADGLTADRIVLAQRVALPVVVHQDPAQVRVPRDLDPHQVERLALLPLGCRPAA